jgi:putative spermidine/putrescine transport system permease protein
MTAIQRWLSAWIGALPLLAVVSLFLVAPIVVLFARSFVTSDGIGLSIWGQLLSQEQTRQGFVNSVALGAACALISTLVGTPLAWFVSRMADRHRTSWLGIFNVAAHFGGIGLAFAYIASLGVFGMVTLFIRGLGIPFVAPSTDSMAAFIISFEYANIPLFVLLMLPSMSIVRDEWREAAETAGATRRQFWQRVGVPVLAPFILGGAVLSFTWAIGIYGIAYALAGTSPVLATPLLTLRIGEVLADDAVNGSARAGALSVVLMLIAVTALVTYRLLVRRGLRWFGGRSPVAEGMSQTSGRERGSRSTFGRRALFALFGIYLALPLVALLLYSFSTSWTDHVLPNGYTLDHWLTTFSDDRAGNALVTSVSLALLTTILTLALVVPAVYWSHTVNRRIRTALEMSAAIPFCLPFIVIALALLQFTGIVAPWWQGSYALLLAGYVAVSFPFVYWAVDGAMAAAGVDRLNEAAAMCGASRRQTIARVVVPSIRTGLASAAMLCFATVIGEYAMVSVLASSINTIPVWSAHVLLDRSNPGFAPLAVVTLTVFVLLLVLSVLVARLTRGAVQREAA